MHGGEKVILKYRDGRILKGYIRTFIKYGKNLQFTELNLDRETEVPVQDLKAIFYVKSFEGKKFRMDGLSSESKGPRVGKKAGVHFFDNERIEGYVQGYAAGDQVILLIPEDQSGNNIKIFCVRNSIDNIQWLDTSTMKRMFDPFDYK